MIGEMSAAFASPATRPPPATTLAHSVRTLRTNAHTGMDDLRAAATVATA